MSDSQLLKPYLAQVADGIPLSEAAASEAFGLLMAGQAAPSQIGGLLMALRVRGETVDEIVGAARAMRAAMTRITAPDGAIDCCGTGGDRSGSVNVSTAVSFVLAGAGLTVAKHGNRAQSSRSGAAEVLSELGVKVDAPLPLVQQALDQAGIAFLMAPLYHSAMRHVGPARMELGVRTVFNLLGPLCNPAGVTRQLLGVAVAERLETLAEALARLGTDRAWLVHGADGMDELSTTGTSTVIELVNGSTRQFAVTPADAGLPAATLDDLRGADAASNAADLRDVLGGQSGAYRDIVLLNAAAALIVAERAETLRDGVDLAADVLDEGKAQAALDRLVAVTNGPPPTG